jgi:hypothetical protein
MRVARPKSRPTPLVALVAVLLLAFAPAARADVGETIIDHCTHGESLAGFSQSDYAKALKELSAGTEEYSDCSSLISKAKLAAASGRGGGGAGGSAGGGARATAVAASPTEQRAISHAAQGGSEPVQLDGHTIAPGVVHTDISSAFSSLPTPLLAMLAVLMIGLLAMAAGALRSRLRSRSGH